ncbi:AEC family transporter [Aquabacterium sp. OR-4]|uniref:AEC family transporter n=1 Tax=Aquabacterium sp. OR-4 TaxID=2978127 RepID=UPI0021B3EBC8|nr:AEC family transporter [Aquabacterium sp. OR-4]MDT7837754.1 AEC family transporter [Aquabacterium sp. OR-4]
MQAILAITLPFFALVLGGWLAARSRLLPEAAVPGLNAYVLYFALPCLLFRFGAGLPVWQLFNPFVMAVWLPVAVLVVGLTVLGTRSARIGLRDASFGALVAAFPNSGFMGVPLLAALMGPAATGPVIATVLIDMVFTSSLCIALSQLQGAGEHGARRAALRALRGTLANPLGWAILLGGAASATGLALPAPLAPVARMVAMLADSATPVALFTIGAVLWRAGQHAHTRTPLAQYLPVALVKLLLHPLLVWGACALAQHLGAPLSAEQATALTLAAALPSASNVALLAERFGADTGRIARIILASTALAFASFTLLAWWFGVQARG